MENKRNDQKTFLIMSVIFTLILVTIVLWAAFDYLTTQNKEGIGVLFVALILAVFAIKMFKDKYESLKRGEPLKDERSRKIELKAAALAFYVGIYWLLALSIAIDAFELEIPASSVPNVGLVGLVIIFGLVYWYFSKKGE